MGEVIGRVIDWALAITMALGVGAGSAWIFDGDFWRWCSLGTFGLLFLRYVDPFNRHY